MKKCSLQMLETWLSKERLLSNSTPRFLTDDEELTEQPSSVRQCSKLLHVGVLGLITRHPVICDWWDKASTKLTYFCSQISFNISQPSYFKLFGHILWLLLCVKNLMQH